MNDFAAFLQDNFKMAALTVLDCVGDALLNYYGIQSKAELKKLAEADMLKFKYDGYEGSFKGFGIPFLQHGDKVQLTSTDYPERDGHYLAEGVAVSFGPDGFERTVKLAQQWTN